VPVVVPALRARASNAGGAKLEENDVQSARTIVMLAVLLLSCGLAPAPGSAAEEKKGTVVSLDGLQSRAPADWQEETPQGSLRLKQFTIPGGGELVIFTAGGGADANVQRWKGQWAPPEGKKLDDVAVVKQVKIADRPAVLLEIEGTYRTAPFDPKHKGKALPGYRMLAIYLDGPANAYQIKFYGPARAIEKQKDAFEQWYKGFK
jgi:hypothetical protein